MCLSERYLAAIVLLFCQDEVEVLINLQLCLEMIQSEEDGKLAEPILKAFLVGRQRLMHGTSGLLGQTPDEHSEQVPWLSNANLVLTMSERQHLD